MRSEPPPGQFGNLLSGTLYRKTTIIAALSLVAILLHFALRFGFHTSPGTDQIPLLVTLVFGGLPLLGDLLRKLLRREFGADLLGGISIVTSVLLGEYLAGSIIVLMLAGGEALESYALRSASSVWRRWPTGRLRLPTGAAGRTWWTWRSLRLRWEISS